MPITISVRNIEKDSFRLDFDLSWQIEEGGIHSALLLNVIVADSIKRKT
jgi:hypothetical protein